ncbi:hypothetical protein HK097_001541 [Rhizophlyctis rosea]|uniref:JmjC domain-containing protein n=1 Tax=Rhizophlyctis rosea TaxID=64517 RepID=A0AAD5S6N3_9FUNG|nr:hypothetical protein HK097_001541 [Rhizophlyctis rosea]
MIQSVSQDANFADGSESPRVTGSYARNTLRQILNEYHPDIMSSPDMAAINTSGPPRRQRRLLPRNSLRRPVAVDDEDDSDEQGGSGGSEGEGDSYLPSGHTGGSSSSRYHANSSSSADRNTYHSSNTASPSSSSYSTSPWERQSQTMSNDGANFQNPLFLLAGAASMIDDKMELGNHPSYHPTTYNTANHSRAFPSSQSARPSSQYPRPRRTEAACLLTEEAPTQGPLQWESHPPYTGSLNSQTAINQRQLMHLNALYKVHNRVPPKETIQMLSRVCGLSVERALGWFEATEMAQGYRGELQGFGASGVEMFAARTDLLRSSNGDVVDNDDAMDVEESPVLEIPPRRARNVNRMMSEDVDSWVPMPPRRKSANRLVIDDDSDEEDVTPQRDGRHGSKTKSPAMGHGRGGSRRKSVDTRKPTKESLARSLVPVIQPAPLAERGQKFPLVLNEAAGRKFREGDSPQTNSCQALNKSTTKLEVCRACIRKDGDPCRFRDFRAVIIVKKSIVDQSFIDKSIDPDAQKEDLHLRSDVHPTPETESYILNTTSPAFRKMLKEELTFLKSHKTTFLRPPIPNTRQNCDICATSIFNAHLVCVKCGMDICLDCVHEWDEERPTNKIDYCKKSMAHAKSDLIVVYRIPVERIKRVLKQAEEWVAKNPDSGAGNVVQEVPRKRDVAMRADGVKMEEEVPFDVFEDSANYVRIKGGKVGVEVFPEEWKKGQIVVVSGLDKRIKADWSPGYFIETHGEEETRMIDCRSGLEHEMTVKGFFDGFLERERKPLGADGAPMILKLKDWPEDKHFREKFPEHYEDFMQLLPFGPYYHRDGILNLAARLPDKCVPPDLGPKMYNAYGSDDGESGKGTTNLHLDMADAVNVMTYANTSDDPLPDGTTVKKPAAAVWDIYAYKDLPALRAFLREYASEVGIRCDDPIHDQWVYLNKGLRERLWREYGVRGWRVFQNVGDAVFVPAGCAHQVCNYRDAVKVAIDFVAPESVEKCEGLTKEFRLLTTTHRRRPDLLQLKTIFWHAWRDCFRNAAVSGGNEGGSSKKNGDRMKSHKNDDAAPASSVSSGSKRRADVMEEGGGNGDATGKGKGKQVVDGPKAKRARVSNAGLPSDAVELGSGSEVVTPTPPKPLTRMEVDDVEEEEEEVASGSVTPGLQRHAAKTSGSSQSGTPSRRREAAPGSSEKTPGSTHSRRHQRGDDEPLSSSRRYADSPAAGGSNGGMPKVRVSVGTGSAAREIVMGGEKKEESPAALGRGHREKKPKEYA